MIGSEVLLQYLQHLAITLIIVLSHWEIPLGLVQEPKSKSSFLMTLRLILTTYCKTWRVQKHVSGDSLVAIHLKDGLTTRYKCLGGMA